MSRRAPKANSDPAVGGAQRTVHISGKLTTILMHRVILNRKLGRMSGRQVNHRTGNSLDNRRRNLREATASQNCQRRKRPNCTSRYIGVSFWSADGKWAAEIFAFSRRVFIGFSRIKKVPRAPTTAQQSSITGSMPIWARSRKCQERKGESWIPHRASANRGTGFLNENPASKPRATNLVPPRRTHTAVGG
jgi:hypothetical protein